VDLKTYRTALGVVSNCQKRVVMKIDCDWDKRASFVANINGFRICMDNGALKIASREFALASLCKDQGLGVIDILRQSKQVPKRFKIVAEASVVADHPTNFRDVRLQYLIDGPCDADKVSDAVHALQNAGVSFDVSLNGKRILSRKSALQDCSA
jgi:hypothetical protein